MIYLDNAATTFPKSSRVYDTMDYFLRNKCVNAGRGGYKLARDATELIDDTRKELLKLVNIQENRNVIFTPSATLALNQIIFGLDWDKYKNVYVTPFEHNAVMRPLHKVAEKYGIEIRVIPFDKKTWEIDQEQLERVFAIHNPDYVIMSHMSNVTGYIIPCEIIMEYASKYNAITIVDAAQSFGTIPIEKKVLDADFLVFAGHKSLYGPMGIGGYIGKPSVNLQTVILGGTGSDSLNLDMPEVGHSRYEAASYNVHAVAGLSAAIKWINDEGQQKISDYKKKLTQYAVTRLREITELIMYIPTDMAKQCSVISFNIDGWNPSDIGMVLDEEFSIAVRTGFHCSPLVHDFLDTQKLYGTVRISIGYFNKQEDIDRLVDSIKKILVD